MSKQRYASQQRRDFFSRAPVEHPAPTQGRPEFCGSSVSPVGFNGHEEQSVSSQGTLLGQHELTLKNTAPQSTISGTENDDDSDTAESTDADSEQLEEEKFEIVNDVDLGNFVYHGASSKMSVLDWIRDNRIWVEFFIKHGLEGTVMDDILANLKAPMKSWKTVVANICSKGSLKPRMQIFAACSGHMCFASLSGSLEADHCHTCRTPRPVPKPGASVHYIPIIPRIQSMLMQENSCKALFQHRDMSQTKPNTYRDFYDGLSYQRICSAYGGTESVSGDIFLAASTDGFQAYKNRTLDVWPVLAIILNLPPEKRYAVKNVLPLMFIPGGRQPTLLQSFLIPLINEVNSTMPEGIIMDFFDGSRRRLRIHLLWFSADLDALTKVASLTGHNGKTPCRFCLIQGVYCPSSRYYYFPCSIRSAGNLRPSIRYNPSSLPLRSYENVKSAIESIAATTKASERAATARETGIKGDSLLFQVANFTPYISFPIDIMHLFYNVQKHLLSIQTGGFCDAFCLTSDEVDVLDSEILTFKDGISGQMAPTPRKLSMFQTCKAAEHKVFTLSYYMVLLDGYVPEVYMSCLGIFVDIVEHCFRPILTEEDVDGLSKLSTRFIKQFEKHFMRYESDRMKMSTYVMHLILHLADGVRENGPLLNTSQYWVERYIGWIVDLLHSRRLPAESFRNAALFLDSYKMAFSFPFSDTSKDDLLDWGETFRFIFLFRTGDIESMGDKAPNLRRLLTQYLTRKYEGMTVREAESISNTKQVCRFWGRIRIRRNGYEDVQAVDACSRTTRGRPSHFLAAEMDVSESKADVYYGKLLYLLEIDLGITDGDILSRFPVSKETHHLAVISWARKLSRGGQQQVFLKGRRDAAFSSPTMEDVSIIMRLIGVVEHAVPTVPKERRGMGQ